MVYVIPASCNGTLRRTLTSTSTTLPGIQSVNNASPRAATAFEYSHASISSVFTTYTPIIHPMMTARPPAPQSAFNANPPTLPANTTTTTDLQASPPRPIALQSPADLLHLRAIALQAAREKIDLHIPPTNPEPAPAAPEHDLRKAVEAYVDAFLDATFRGVRAGVEINGLPGPDAVSWDGNNNGDGNGDADHHQEEYEDFDAKLAARITGLHSRIEGLNQEVAGLRREAVARAAGDFREGFGEWDRGLAEVEEKMGQEEEARAQEEGSGGLVREVDERLMGREEKAQETWERALEGLRRLNEEGGLGAAVERAEEAGRVVQAMGERGK